MQEPHRINITISAFNGPSYNRLSATTDKFFGNLCPHGANTMCFAVVMCACGRVLCATISGRLRNLWKWTFSWRKNTLAPSFLQWLATQCPAGKEFSCQPCKRTTFARCSWLSAEEALRVPLGLANLQVKPGHAALQKHRPKITQCTILRTLYFSSHEFTQKSRYAAIRSVQIARCVIQSSSLACSAVVASWKLPAILALYRGSRSCYRFYSSHHLSQKIKLRHLLALPTTVLCKEQTVAVVHWQRWCARGRQLAWQLWLAGQQQVGEGICSSTDTMPFVHNRHPQSAMLHGCMITA